MSRLRVLLHLSGRVRLPQSKTSWLEAENDKVSSIHQVCEKDAKVGEKGAKGKVQNSRKTQAWIAARKIALSMSDQKVHENCQQRGSDCQTR